MSPKFLILSIIFTGSLIGISAALAQDDPKNPMQNREPQSGFTIPCSWTRQGVVIARQQRDKGVSGDPCIVWDEAINGWRMVLFYDPPGHAQAVCLDRDNIGPGHWKFEGPLPVVNPQAVGGFHKPFIVMDPDHANHAANIDGRYCLLVGKNCCCIAKAPIDLKR